MHNPGWDVSQASVISCWGGGLDSVSVFDLVISSVSGMISAGDLDLKTSSLGIRFLVKCA